MAIISVQTTSRTTLQVWRTQLNTWKQDNNEWDVGDWIWYSRRRETDHTTSLERNNARSNRGLKVQRYGHEDLPQLIINALNMAPAVCLRQVGLYQSGRAHIQTRINVVQGLYTD